MINGIINVYKEKGFTSHDVVAKLRGILHQKKIGHTGTLDPDAVGVLPVCLGRATKLCEFLTDHDKVYEAELRLGITTDTEDTTGKVLCEKEVRVTQDEVLEAIHSFVGEYQQVPPMYSAIKVEGKKLYELAREGVVIERKPRPVTIYDITVLEMTLPVVKMRVHCSKGTYIRSLCRDIGEKLGCGGCMSSLVRTKVAQFEIENSLTLSEIQKLSDENKIENNIVTIDSIFTEYQEITVSKEYNRLIYNGNMFSPKAVKEKETKDGSLYRVYSEKREFIGVYQYNDSKKMFTPVKIFYDPKE